MAVSNVHVKLSNGGLGRSSATSDSVAGMILTGRAVAGKLELNKAYVLSSVRDLEALGITEADNALVKKDVEAFYTAAGDGSELHLVVVAEATMLTAMVAATAEAPIHKLIASGSGRIRLVGINKIAGAEYEPTLTEGIDSDVVSALASAHAVALSYADKVRPFRTLVPAYGYQADAENLFQPRRASYNTVGVVLAADKKIGEVYSAAIGQVLGRGAAVEPQQSLGRVKDGAIAASGYFTDGVTPDAAIARWDALDDAGYIFYRTFAGKNGLYLNGDPMAAPLTDDYSDLNLGRIIDKARVIAYTTYVDEILDNVELDEAGNLAVGACVSFEGMLENAVMSAMQGQISSFEATIDPAQNILSTGVLTISATVVPLGIMRTINVNLGFSNPYIKS